MKKKGWILTAVILLAGGIVSEGYAAPDPGNKLITLAGVPGDGNRDGSGQEARFAGPMGIAMNGNAVLIADTDNNQIRSYHGDRVTTYAGTESGLDEYGHDWGGYQDNYSDRSIFNKPSDCAVLTDGRIAVVDRENHSIRILEKNRVYTLGGSGEAGYQERGAMRANVKGNDGGKTSMFNSPSGVAAGPDNLIYIADTGNHCIRGIRQDGSSFLVAGTPGEGGYQDGDVFSARFMEPFSVAAGADGALYVADMGNQRIRKIFDGQVTTLAGTGTARDEDTGYVEPAEDREGQIGFCYPLGICVAGDTVIVADTGNHRICAIAPWGEAAVIAGNGEAGFQDDTARDARLHSPGDVAWSDGMLYIMDTGSSALRVMRFDPEEWLKGQKGQME